MYVQVWFRCQKPVPGGMRLGGSSKDPTNLESTVEKVKERIGKATTNTNRLLDSVAISSLMQLPDELAELLLVLGSLKIYLGPKVQRITNMIPGFTGA